MLICLKGKLVLWAHPGTQTPGDASPFPEGAWETRVLQGTIGRPYSNASGLSSTALRKLWKGAQLWVWAQKPGVWSGPVEAEGP